MVRQALLKCLACTLSPELCGDVAARVDEDVSHVTATILVTGDNEVPRGTRIRVSMRGCECLAVTQGITKDDERLTCLESVDHIEVGAWSAPSVHAARGIAPDGTCMIMSGHSFVNLLFSPQRKD